ncbi:MAG TPA: DnaA/Hda family protein [Gemmatimonadaceae bacterium]
MELDTRYRFENYVVGSANRLAVSAARAVAQAPGAAYNPLFIYSSSGLGKTHLMLAIGNYAVQLQPDLQVEYSTVDEFVDELTNAISVGSMEAFKRRHQRAGMLLLDDIQFLAGRRETQSEMLRLFDTLQRSGTQVVFTSDRPPSEIADLDERLITRFSGGLVVDVAAPDYETRVAILRMRCGERGESFEPAVLEAVARIGFGNVRELQGALNRLIACQSLAGTPVTPGSVRALLGERAEVGVTASVGGGMAASEFDGFLSDVTEVVTQHLEPWRLRVMDAANHWRSLGFETTMLERVLDDGAHEGQHGEEMANALLERYESTVERLGVISAEVARFGAGLVAPELLRDPERIAEAEQALARAIGVSEPPPGPSDEYSRSGFEVSPSNQLAVHAADAVIEEPGGKYNPLFVYGPSGVGKTHLLHALGNDLLSMSGGAMLVACLRADQFVDELIAALGEGTIERWRTRYRAVDVLILDDVQACVGKERTQEELFHIFNGLYSLGRQIILSADSVPTSIAGLDERLRSRFAGGLVVEIQPPDDLLRRKLISRRLAGCGQPYDQALVEYLASLPTTGAADVAATVDWLVHAADSAGSSLDESFARRELGASVSGVPVAANGADGALVAGSVGNIAVAARTGPTVATPANGRVYDALFLDREKVVWEWPDLSGRAIEELR